MLEVNKSEGEMNIAMVRGMSFVCLLFYILATSNAISGWVPTCDNLHSWQFYSAASLDHQATGTMICYPTQ